HGSGCEQAAAPADQRQGARRASEDSAPGVRRGANRRHATPCFQEEGAHRERAAVSASIARSQKLRQPAWLAAPSTDAALCTNRIARFSAGGMPAWFGLAALAFS